ncbi:MAG: hypothetical protein K2K70_05425, partial [Lachnospiraceae bacterium]|nr:hypothetical protein [Lachnospiraceae bacterium]
MKNKKPVIIGVLVVVLVALIAVTVHLIKKNTPSKTHMSLQKYFSVEDGQAKVILNDRITDAGVLCDNGKFYLDITFVNEYLNPRFYWDTAENVLLYTTSTAMIQTDLDSQDVYINKSKESKDYVTVKTDGQTAYVALDYIKEYTALDYKTYQSPNRVVIQNIYNTDISYYDVKKDAALRAQPNIKSDILVDLKEKDQVRVPVLTGDSKQENSQEKDADKQDDASTEDPATTNKEDTKEKKEDTKQKKELKEDKSFVQVMSKDGVIGYVKKDHLSSKYSDQSKTDFKEEKYSHILMDEKVVLAWHQVTNQTANAQLANVLAGTKGVNVVAPTWFQTSDNKGNISSLASDAYVQAAHRAGVKVWALCDDFAANMKIGKVLSVSSRRQRLAKNLTAEAIRYSLDGINIDFENVKQENGKDFVQFIRELGIMCRNNGISLSIDNYPLRDFNAYYDRAEQAAVADYVITMAYDEYYSGSEQAGPVSSLSYVTSSISLLDGVIPAEQHVVALPFYSRLWAEKTKDGKVDLSCEAYSMRGAQGVVADSKAELKWDDATSMNYL